MTVQVKHKDRLFNFIFGREDHKEWTLSLYNAVNGSNYTNPDLVEFNTLEDMLYLGMKNDTSFLISDIMNIYEHQSTYNPNMPLRMLGYTDELYSGYLTKYKLNKYGSTLVSLPVPKLVVFYNGETETEDETILRLTDSFPEEVRSGSDIEVRVRMLNINYGRNKELLEACRPLSEYAWFVREIRRNRENHNIEEAVNMAMNTMPNDYSIREFLVIHKDEVSSMLARDYSEDEIRELFMEDGRKEGREEERKNTEAERKEKEAEKQRADKAEMELNSAKTELSSAKTELADMKAELAKYKKKYGEVV